jgi:hypothetical protein
MGYKMKNCDDFKQFVDIRYSTKNINQEQKELLSEHLKGCDSCQQYHHQAEKFALLFLHNQKEQSAHLTKRDHIYQHVTKHRASLDNQTRFSLAGIVSAVIAISYLAINDTITTLGGGIFLLFITLCSFFLWHSAARSNLLNILSNTDDELMNSGLSQMMKKELNKKIKIITYYGPIVMLETGIIGVFLLFVDGLLSLSSLIAFSACLLITSFVIYQFIVELPKLKIELSQLEQEGAA